MLWFIVDGLFQTVIVLMTDKKQDKIKVAFKKIKLGEFKDGLDMSAIREIKYLQELAHPNIMKVDYLI